jgi:uncharacterized membrane protein
MKTERMIGVLGAVLFASLAINIFMGGMVVGKSVSTAPKAVSDDAAQDRQLRDTMSDADKLVLKQAMDANRKKITQLHDDIEKIKQDLRNIIKKDSVDEKALNAVLETRKNKELQMLELAHETRKAAMEKLSPEGRAILSKVSHLGFDLNPPCR